MTKQAGRVKGGKIAAAKRKAKQTGQPVALDEYGLLIQPDGTVYQKGTPQVSQQEPDSPAPAAQELPSAADPTQGAGAPTDPVRAYMAELSAKGLSGAEVLALVNGKFGGQDSPAAPGPATPGSPEILGPDPAVVARHQEFLRTYTAPKLRFRVGAFDKGDEELKRRIESCLTGFDLADNVRRDLVSRILESCDEQGGVELPKLFYDWVVMWAAWQSARLRMQTAMPLGQAIGMMVREHWQFHGTERAMIQAAKTGSMSSGPAGAYKPDSGTWG